MTRTFLVTFLATALTSISSGQELTFTFGSCNKVKADQHLWGEILSEQSDYWIWLGDNIYGDTKDVDKLRNKYAAQNANPGYAQLKKVTPVTGIWDDHDYGINDGDKNHPTKAGSRNALFDFLDMPPDDPARAREGAYHDLMVEDNGLSAHLIFLDGRYFRDPIQRLNGVYLADSSAQLLGEKQWRWLRETMKASSADIFVLACGIQFIPDEHRFEKWANHPSDQAQLFELIRQIDAPVILLSGDRHRGEIMSRPIDDQYPLVEITSSSLTHSHPSDGEPNRFRVGPLVMVNHYGVLHLSKDQNGIQMSTELISEGGNVESRFKMTYH